VHSEELIPRDRQTLARLPARDDETARTQEADIGTAKAGGHKERPGGISRRRGEIQSVTLAAFGDGHRAGVVRGGSARDVGDVYQADVVGGIETADDSGRHHAAVDVDRYQI